MTNRFQATLGCAIIAQLMLVTSGFAAETDKRPNIVLILADDLGYTDTAPYGGEIDTPNISALASQGILFTNYHTAASCAPTRAMLLTGVDSHRNGVPNIPEAIPPKQKRHNNYTGTLSRNVVTVATLLKEHGYNTFMTGKWHLGHEPELLPIARGFEHTITMPYTGADNWEQRPYLPIYSDANWYADGKPHTLPEDFYSSKYFIDKTIEFLDGRTDKSKPFFSYIPFQAVHLPVQAPQEFTDKYIGRYDAGWTKIRQQRLETAQALGIVPADIDMVVTPGTADWNARTAEEQRYDSKRMAVYAGMVDAMDYHIGRLIAHLKETGEYDNTIFIFTSDNGAEGSDPMTNGGELLTRWMDKVGYARDYETLGTKGSYSSLGANFATAAAAPLAFYKFYSGEGGMRVPLIIAGTRIEAASTKTDAMAWVTDITPTILALAGVEDHGGTHEGRSVEEIIGHSLLPLITDDEARVYTDEDVIGYELGGNAALFKGDYKITFNRGPLGDNTWHLFNIKTDPGEARDLTDIDLERLAEMTDAYDLYVKNNNVLPVAENYDQVKQVFINAMKERYALPIKLAIAGFMGLLLLAGFLIWRRRRAK